jgi:hypothetical protein
MASLHTGFFLGLKKKKICRKKEIFVFVFTTRRAFGRKCEHDRGSLARKIEF